MSTSAMPSTLTTNAALGLRRSSSRVGSRDMPWPCDDTDGRCEILPVIPYIRSEEYGFSGFDNFLQAMLTMFVQMTGDNGMQDIPFALDNAGGW